MIKRRKTMTTPMPSTNHADVVLVGAGIMSATLAVFLKELDPTLKIELYEVLGSRHRKARTPGTMPAPAMQHSVS